MSVQERAYSIRILFHKVNKPEKPEKPDEEWFRCLIARSPQGAITKSFLRSRSRKGKHGNYGCQKMTIEIRCLGMVDR